MSKLTEFLGLFKWDTTNETDKKSKFNIEKSMNENWDKLDANAEDVKDKIESLHSENAELKERLIDAENNQLTGQATGTSIDIYDSADSRVRDVEIGGHSEQETTEGKNKFAGADTTINNGITFKKNSDGSYNITGSATAQAYAYNYVDINNSGLVNGQTYTFWASQVLPAEFFVLIEAYNGTTWQRHAMNGLKVTNQSESQVISLTDTTRIRFGLRVSEGTTINISNLKIQLESGSTATNFEKYTGGQAAPSPDYPQEITNVTGDVEVKVQNKNLNPYPYKDTTKTKNGITFTDNGDGTINVNGTASSTTYFDMTSNGSTKGIKLKAGTYNVSIGASSNVRATIAKYSNISEVVAFIPINTSSTTFTIEEDTEITFVLAINNGLSANNILIKPQLEKNSTPTSYVAHEEQTYTVPTQQPMRSIGDVRDKFVKVDGTWYERHYIGQVVLDGSESGWKRTPTGNNNYYFFIDDIVLNCLFNSNVIIGMSNIGIAANPYREIQGVDTIFYDSHNRTRLYAETTKAMSISDFQTWLSNNNVELIYVLETPVDLPCTEEQVEVLESIRTYKNVTHITSEDEIEAEVDVTYVRDLETYLNNLVKGAN